MKTKSSRRLLFGSLILAFAVWVASCGKDDDHNNNNTTMYSISGNASGSQETPTNATTGTATLSGTYNKSTNVLTYTINWMGLTGNVSAAHFHGPADLGVAADPIVPIIISTNGTAGSVSGTATLDETEESYLLAGRIYYNLHTVGYPNGEIRGQVTARSE